MNEENLPRELHGSKKFRYNLGYFGLYLAILLESVFAFQFYVYTVNLDAFFVTLGFTIQMFISALAGIIFGVIIDNKRPNKFGKRRLFLLYGLPIWFLTCILLWTPPTFCPEGSSMHLPTASYLWIVLIIKGVSGTSILVAHGSMLPEQSQTHENRKKVASQGTILTIFASILAMLLPLMVQSILEDPENVKWWDPSGQVILFYIPIIGISIAVFAAISLILTFYSVDEGFHTNAKNSEFKKSSIKAAFQQMKIPLSDINNRKYLFAVFFINVANKIVGLVLFPFLIYVLLFIGPLYYIYIIVSICTKIAWYQILKYFLKKYDVIKSFKFTILLTVIASAFELLFLITTLSFEFKVFLFVLTFGTILGGIYGFGLFYGPLISNLINEAAEKVESRDKDKFISDISGSYFGLSTFMASIGPAIGSILVGVILTGANKSNSTIITITLASAGIFFLVSFIYIGLIKLKRT